MTRYDALELMYKALPQTFRDAAMDGRPNGYPWLPAEAKELGVALRRMKRLDTSDEIPYTEVMDLMKSICGYDYRTIGDESKRSLRGIFAKGYTLEDFRKVFTRKAKDWQGTKWAEYLRPSTLLGRFEEYHSAPTSGSLPGGAEVHRAQGTTTGPNGGATDEAVKAVKGVW